MAVWTLAVLLEFGSSLWADTLVLKDGRRAA